VSIVSAYLRSIRAVIKSEKRDVSVDGFVNTVTLKELGNMNGDKFEEYFTSGEQHSIQFYSLMWLHLLPESRQQLFFVLSLVGKSRKQENRDCKSIGKFTESRAKLECPGSVCCRITMHF